MKIAFMGGLACISSLGQAKEWSKVQTGLQERTVRVGNQERTFLLYVPKSYDGKTRVPIVMMLHGGGGTGKAAMEETGWDKKAEEEGFLAQEPEKLIKSLFLCRIASPNLRKGRKPWKVSFRCIED